MKKRKVVITIDGPAAAGKSTVGKKLARELGYLYIDSGALYRAVALKALRGNISLNNGQKLKKMIRKARFQPVRTSTGMRMILDEEDVTDEIRGERAGFAASTVSAHPEVRGALLQLQRDLGREGGIIMDGRDIGTVIFPEAEIKFFLDASPQERGRRRYKEMKTDGHKCNLEKIVKDINKRDRQDRSRDHAPLEKAPDAVYVDTTQSNPDEVVALMKRHIEKIVGSSCQD